LLVPLSRSVEQRSLAGTGQAVSAVESGMTRRITALLALTLPFFQSGPVPAQPKEPTRALAPALHWAQFPVRVYVEAKDGVRDQKALIVLAGLDEWVDAAHEKVCYVRTLDPKAADITVRFEATKFLSADSHVIGETEVLWSGSTLKKASIRLAEGAGTLEDLQATAAHEFGHALGIQQHSSDQSDLMFPVEVLHDSQIGDPLPEETPYVTAHDLRLLAAGYPQLLRP